MAIHADLWDEEADLEESIHRYWARAFVDAADDFGRPVLLIHGDEQVQTVRINVDPSDPAVFGFMPIIVSKNFD